jgi:Flp pilus assembly protein CpaB
VFGVVVALVSIVLTALAFLFVFPSASTLLSPRSASSPGDRSNGQAREVVFNADDRLQVVVALQRLPRGFTIPADAYNNAIGVREWPAASVPNDAVIVEAGQDPLQVIQEQVVGRVTRTDIEREQPILRAALADNLTDLARVGSDIGAQLPAGMEAIALPIDQLSSVAFGVQPGDRVDLIFTFQVLDVDQEFQSALPNWIYLIEYGSFSEDGARIAAQVVPQPDAAYGRIDTIPPGELANVVPSEPQRPRVVSQRAILDAMVLYVGQVPADGQVLSSASSSDAQRNDGSSGDAQRASTDPDVVVLGVTPQDTVVISWAVNAGVDVNLVIRSVQDVPNAATSSVTLQYIFETYNVPVPPKLPYGLEPTLRDAPAAGQPPGN